MIRALHQSPYLNRPREFSDIPADMLRTLPRVQTAFVNDEPENVERANEELRVAVYAIQLMRGVEFSEYPTE